MGLLALFILINLFCSGIYAGTGKEHKDLWNASFGIVDITFKKAVEPLWNTAQDMIDEYNPDYKNIKYKFP